MAPKKPQQKDKKEFSATCGLFSESCLYPGWDDQDNQFENWGGDLALPISHVEASQLFNDPEFQSSLEGCFQHHIAEWKRPSALFSPFKPVVFRSSLPPSIVNPYEYQGKGGQEGKHDSPHASPRDGNSQVDDDDDNGEPTTREEAVKLYRRMRPLVVGEVDGAVSLDASIQTSPNRRTRRHKSEKQSGSQTPYFMRAFNSALMMLSQCQHAVPAGQYAWELIYPQAPNTANPMYNPYGKYAVKLFVGGAFRRVVVDDKLPVDVNGNSLISVTEQKEIWPAILAKAILKVLGSSHEELLVTNPMVVASFLLPGWVPQRLDPREEAVLSLQALRAVGRNHVTATTEELICLTTGDSATWDCTGPAQESNHNASLASADHTQNTSLLHSQGTRIPHRQAFFVLDVQPYLTTTMVRLISPHVRWQGQYSYENNCWNMALENAIKFNPSQDRDVYGVQHCGWNDFWVTYEELVDHFQSLVIWRNVGTSKLWSVFRQFAASSDGAAAAAAPAPAKGAPPSAPASPSPAASGTQHWSKWCYMKVTDSCPRHILLTLTGLPKGGVAAAANPPSQSQTPRLSIAPSEAHPKTFNHNPHAAEMTVLTVQHYQWTSPVPFANVATVTVLPGVPQCTLFSVPPGQHAYRITASHMPANCGLSLMCDAEFSAGDEKDICQNILQISSVMDAGVFQPHPAGQSTIWFKRLIQVKQNTTANMFLSVLPKGSDINQHRTVGGDGGQAAKGAKAAPPPAKGGKGGATTEATSEQMDEVDHEVPITAYSKLILVNLDTNHTLHDTVLKLLHVVLTPNTKGYMLMAFATVPREAKEVYGRGMWKLHATSDRPFDTFEPRGFEEMTVRQAEYVHNDYNTLFKYNFTVAEAATGTIQLNLQEQWGIPFHVTLLHNDKEFDSKKDAKVSCLFEHVTLIPSDKTTPSTYSIHCVLDSKFTQEWEERRRVQVVQLFQKNCKEQESLLKLKQDELHRQLTSGATQVSDSHQTTAATATHSLNTSTAQDDGSAKAQLFSIPFQLILHLSTNKVEVKEDNSIQEHLMQVKASWAKKESEQAAAAAGGAQAKGGKAAAAKGQPVVDEASLRQQRSKESREKFLSNLKGVFLPYHKEGKNFLEYHDEPGLRKAPIFPPSARQTVHLTASTEPSPCVTTTATPSAPVAAPNAAAGAAAAAAGQAAATQLAPHVIQLFKTLTTDLFDEVNALAQNLKNEKKEVNKQISETTNEYWVLHRPDRSGAQGGESGNAAADDDKGKKPPPKGGKK